MTRKFLLLNIMAAFILTSCAGNVIKRNRKGRQERDTPRQVFTGIKKKIILLNFFNESPYGGEDLGVTATEELRKELVGTGEFIIDPMAEKIFGSSKEVYAGGGVKLVQMARKAKIAGVNFVVYGRILEARVREKSDEIGVVRKTRSYTESKIEIRIFDVTSSKEIFNERLGGYADDSSYRLFKLPREEQLSYRRNLLRYSTRVAARKAIPQITAISAKLNWTGRVAKIIANKIYINAGRESGINVGDILKVLTEGAEIFDPETGALIGISKGEVKGTVEIIDYFGSDGAIAILHSGGSIQEGDYVQLY